MSTRWLLSNRASEPTRKQGSLLVYDKDGMVVAKFGVSKVEHWWTGSTKKPDIF
jgi:hypothetical protein